MRNVVLGALAVLAAACQSPRPAQPAQQKENPSAPVAKVGGQAITTGELDELVKSDLKQLEQQYEEQKYQLKRQGLESMIRRRVFEAKAKAEGITPDELVNRDVVAKIPEPADDEVRALYERAKAGGQQLPPIDQVKPDIARFIKNQKAQAELTAYYEKLKKDMNVEVLLPAYMPPKVEVAATGPSKGPNDAPITIVEFSDFQCPFCVRAEPTVKDVMAAYPGKVRVVYRDFPLPSHDLAPKAAEAAHCAGDQGKYWEMHDRLFAANGKLAVDDLKGYAREVGADGAKFDRCLESGEKAPVVQEHHKAGEAAGVSGTPAFFINGRLISGAQPLEAFKAVIDQELKAAGKQ
ncbi:DSBA oxidoreductase [Anaeromyxobacter dehalogenans 2CP-1]|uniref:DSBA oxidoreductase n=1 Tax=Anaeromyxobacter dehalogenans (strain ATCC BAA-258 / DSM 21875 / 2CP-1) TaxID=455488 RepID=B8J9M3_ANAD2|nr:thioredoxin [Anaeromyxobacter dehalogenans]ACL67411.1 DSBA oxidoreductase [Anaeromyxobacter dehalogenans 2CP-1]